MKPAPFNYRAVRSLDEAFAVLAAEGEEAKIIAGGQSLAPMMNLRLAQPRCLVDINRVPDLAFVRDEGEWLALGALLRHHDLARHPDVRSHCPILAKAAATIASYAVRQRGTLGGSLVQADPAAQLPLIATLFDAEIELTSREGTRRLRATDFFHSVFTTAIAESEILTAMRVPKREPREGWGVAMFSAVAGDYAIASAAATLLRAGDGRIARLRLALGSLGPTPLRIDTAGAVGASPAPDWIAAFAQATAGKLEIEETAKVTAEYRRELAAAMIEDALTRAAERSA